MAESSPSDSGSLNLPEAGAYQGSAESVTGSSGWVESPIVNGDQTSSGRGEPDSGAGAAPGGGADSEGRDDRPVLPTKSSDDTDEGWGERESEDRDEQFRRDRPPHWD
jgi:hypothetical protein